MALLQNKVAIITGAASGIGRGVAELFVEHGAKVIIADINEELAESTANEIGGTVQFKRVDVTDESSVKSVSDFAVTEHGQLDILHNNAGAFGARGSIMEIESDAFDSTINLLLRSVFYGMKHAGNAMKKVGNKGAILNTASISATSPGYGPHIYQAAKAAVLQLTKSAALELGEYNIRVNCISPGGVYTPLIGGAFGISEKETADLSQAMGAEIPLNRTGTPLDIARAALFLCSDLADFVTGQDLIVDGAEATGKKFTQQGLH